MPSSKTSGAKQKRLLLLTNDDGFQAEGLQALHRALKDIGDLYIVAPDRQKSASSLSLTLHRPLRVQQMGPRSFAVDGTPADCVYLAVQKLCRRKPDLLLSGINRGPNLGRQDISYSGTVAAAIQGTYLGIPSLAISLKPEGESVYSFAFAAEIMRRGLEKLLRRASLPLFTLNINIPPPPFKGVRITNLGEKRYNPEIIEKRDPRNNFYYWIGPGNPRRTGGPKSDIRASEEGFVSITPLHTDLTDFRMLEAPRLKTIAAGFSAGDGNTRRSPESQK